MYRFTCLRLLPLVWMQDYIFTINKYYIKAVRDDSHSSHFENSLYTTYTNSTVTFHFTDRPWRGVFASHSLSLSCWLSIRGFGSSTRIYVCITHTDNKFDTMFLVNDRITDYVCTAIYENFNTFQHRLYVCLALFSLMCVCVYVLLLLLFGWVLALHIHSLTHIHILSRMRRYVCLYVRVCMLCVCW